LDRVRLGCAAAWLLLLLMGPWAGAARAQQPDLFPVDRIELHFTPADVPPPIDRAALADLLSTYEGRSLTTGELIDLRDAITQRYVDAGYVNSGAVIGGQDLRDRVLDIDIVLGTLGEVTVTGTTMLDPAYVEERIRLAAGVPFDLDALRERLQILLKDPAIAAIDASLLPGEQRGEARLAVEVEERPPLSVDTSLANDQAPSVGSLRLDTVALWRSVTGAGDPLRLEGAVSEGSYSLELGYERPVTASDLRLRVVADYADADVIEDPFDELDIESNSSGIEVGASYPIYRSPLDDVLLDLSLERRHGESFLLGDGFSFAPGTKDGVSDVTALRFAQTWRRQDRQLAFAAQSIFSFGLDALGSSDRCRDADGERQPCSEFFTWQGQIEAVLLPFATRPDWVVADHQLALRAGGQIAADPLLPSEQFTVGGIDTVRGYRENALVRDTAWFASLEYRIPLGRLPIPALQRNVDDGLVQLIPFIDVGGGQDKQLSALTDDTIASAGLGIRWQPSDALDMALYVAQPFEGRPDDSNDLQDLGIHFRISFGAWPWPFAQAEEQ
jgi:hemolysin activation/secretion protein